MFSETLVELARWQFAVTAMLHFLFIPLTLGLGLWLALLETLHAGGRASLMPQIEFWRRIFAIDFALALVSRLTVIFQFAGNGSYFSHYVGDALAWPLAIEALTSFFVAAAVFAPYCFGRDKLGTVSRLIVVWLMVLACHASAYWIMLDYAWMQHPLGVAFDPSAYRLQLTDVSALFANPILPGKYLHTVTASHAAAAGAVLAIAAWRLLRRRGDEIALDALRVAGVWGLAALLATAVVGEDTVKLDTPAQRAKAAAISGVADPGLSSEIQRHIRDGVEGYRALLALRDDSRDPRQHALFQQYQADLGYAMLLRPLSKQIVDASEQQIVRAAQSALPSHPELLFWLYRLMLVCCFLGLAGFAAIAWLSRNPRQWPDGLSKVALFVAPLPWLACIAGWFISEAGKQPWAVAGMLPTFAGISTLTVRQLLVSWLGYATVYGLLFAVAVILMKRTLERDADGEVR